MECEKESTCQGRRVQRERRELQEEDLKAQGRRGAQRRKVGEEADCALRITQTYMG
jgi:hypothetical protein